MRIAGDSVHVSERDIAEFMCVFPCSGLHGLRGVTFTYERNGDLVDIRYRNGSSEQWDGEGLLALSHDAQEYAGLREDKLSRKISREQYREKGFPWWWPDSWGR